MPRLIDAHEVYKYLNSIGGCDAEPESWSDGWDKAIDAAICGLDDVPTIVYSWHKWPDEKPKQPGAYIATLKGPDGPFTDAVNWTGKMWGGIRTRCVYGDNDILAWSEFPGPWEGE